MASKLKPVVVDVTCSSSGAVTIEGDVSPSMVLNLDLSKIESDEGVAKFLESNIITNESYRPFLVSLTFSVSHLSDKASYTLLRPLLGANAAYRY
jgi:hypothetical protein